MVRRYVVFSRVWQEHVQNEMYHRWERGDGQLWLERVLPAYEEEHPGTYFWFDLFTNNQHHPLVVPPEFLATVFKDAIGEIGTTLLVLAPWSNPVPLTRCWCLWEILCTVQTGAELVVRLPQEQEGKFKAGLLEDFNVAVKALSEIDAEKAEARQARDREMIFTAIRTTIHCDRARNTDIATPGVL